MVGCVHGMMTSNDQTIVVRGNVTDKVKIWSTFTVRVMLDLIDAGEEWQVSYNACQGLESMAHILV